MPEVDDVHVADQASTLHEQLRRNVPGVILVDANLGRNQVVALLRRLRAAALTARCIILSDDVWQHEPYLSAGADVVLVKGFLGESLREAVLDRA
jgi:DNA-binding NarL/FixJ family response regulator